MVMEYVHAVKISGDKSLPQLEKLAKLKINTICEGIAITSLEHKLPCFLGMATAHKVL